MGSQRHNPLVLIPRKRPGVHRTKGWVCPRFLQEKYGEIIRLPGFERGNVASRWERNKSLNELRYSDPYSDHSLI
jgi:hypothetical protein